MASERSIHVCFDDDDDHYGSLIRKAFDQAREIAASDPERALRGFKLAIRDETNELLLEVEFGPRQRQATLH